MTNARDSRENWAQRGRGPLRYLLPGIVATLVIIVWAMCLCLNEGRDSGLAESSIRLERLGSQTTSFGGPTAVEGTSIGLGRQRARSLAVATWSLPGVAEFNSILPHTRDCKLSLYVVGSFEGDPALNGAASVFLNDERVGVVHPYRGADPFKERFGDAAPSTLFTTPLYQPAAIIFPVPSEPNCRNQTWNLTVHIRGAVWRIDRIGVRANYRPLQPASSTSLFADLAVFGLLVILMSASIAIGASTYSKFGVTGLAAFVAVCLLASVTHDEWDFPIWARMVDLAAIGRTSPALMWEGSPLWPVLLAAFAPLRTFSGWQLIGGAEAVSLFIKLSLAQVYALSALLLAKWPANSRSHVRYWTWLLSPFGLFVLAAGYREIVAGLFIIVGLNFCFERKYVTAVICLVCASSISEVLVPTLLLPGTLYVADGYLLSLRTILRGACLGAFAVAVFAIQWFVLLPRNTAHTALVDRTTSYRFGGGSLYSVLDTFHLLPPWVGAHSFELFLYAFVLMSLPPIILTVLLLWRDPSYERRQASVYYCVLALVISFVLAFRNTDPNTWYAVFALIAAVLARLLPRSAFPLYLSLAGAAAFYAIAGVADFVDWWALAPMDRGLLGTLGLPVQIFVALVTALLLSLYGAIIFRRTDLLDSSSSWLIVATWFCCILCAAIVPSWLDVVLVTSFAVLICIALERVTSEATPLDGVANRHAQIFVAIGIGGIAFGLFRQNVGVILGMLTFLILACRRKFLSVSDFAFAFSGSLLFIVEPGTTAVSVLGYIALLIAAFFAGTLH